MHDKQWQGGDIAPLNRFTPRAVRPAYAKKLFMVRGADQNLKVALRFTLRGSPALM